MILLLVLLFWYSCLLWACIVFTSYLQCFQFGTEDADGFLARVVLRRLGTCLGQLLSGHAVKTFRSIEVGLWVEKGAGTRGKSLVGTPRAEKSTSGLHVCEDYAGHLACGVDHEMAS